MKANLERKRKTMQIILASQSPRRKALLEQMGIKKYQIIVSDIEEKMDTTLTIKEQVKKLSYQKAEAVWNKTEGERIVIGADTIVEKDGKIYEKPKNQEAAVVMLKELSNAKVKVLTGMTVLIQNEKQKLENVECTITEIYIKDMTEDEIRKWIATGKAIDRSGAFSLQDEFTRYVEKIVGDFNSAVGLSTSKLYDIIKEYI